MARVGRNHEGAFVQTSPFPAGRDPVRTLSIRDVEELLAQRGIELSREAV